LDQKVGGVEKHRGLGCWDGLEFDKVTSQQKNRGTKTREEMEEALAQA
jgi:hypothetical protein